MGRHESRRRSGVGTALLLMGVGLALYAVKRARHRTIEPELFAEVAAEWEERFANVDGVRMRWLEHGQGTPLVLVHGIPTSPLLWRKVLPLLRHAHAFAWEMVGYGASIPEGEGRDISVGRQADYLAAWLRQMDMGPVVLAGHDLGGGVAQIVAARHPELCSGIFLTNAVTYDSWPIPEVKAMRTMAGVVERLPEAAVHAALRMLLTMGHDNRAATAAAASVHLPNYRGRHAGDDLLRQMRSLDPQDTLAVQDDLPHLRIPARVVWGAADRFQKLHYGKRVAHDLGTTVERIEGGRHFTPEDHPVQLAEAINDLLREVEEEAQTRQARALSAERH